MKTLDTPGSSQVDMLGRVTSNCLGLIVTLIYHSLNCIYVVLGFILSSNDALLYTVINRTLVELNIIHVPVSYTHLTLPTTPYV